MNQTEDIENQYSKTRSKIPEATDDDDSSGFYKIAKEYFQHPWNRRHKPPPLVVAGDIENQCAGFKIIHLPPSPPPKSDGWDKC